MKTSMPIVQTNWMPAVLSALALSLGLLSGCAEDKGGGGVPGFNPGLVCQAGLIQYNGTCIAQDPTCGINAGRVNGVCVQGVLSTQSHLGIHGQSPFQSATAFVGTISVTDRNLFSRYLAATGRCQENAIQPVTGWPGSWPGTTAVSIQIGAGRCHFYSSSGAVAIDFGDTRGFTFGAVPGTAQVAVAGGAAIGGNVDWGHVFVTGGAIISPHGQMAVSPRNSGTDRPSFVAYATTGHPYAVGTFEIESSAVNLRDANEFVVTLRYSQRAFATAVVRRQVGTFHHPGHAGTIPGAWGVWPQPRPVGVWGW